MRKRLVKKVVKKYGNSWWAVISDTKESCSYALVPPSRWNIKKVLAEFHKQRFRNNLYHYAIMI